VSDVPPAMAAPADLIEVRGLRLWAHVGVLEQEREEGQWFELAFRLGGDLAVAARNDDLAASYDYAQAITALQAQSRTIRCLTIEHYSERILALLEECYGAIPLELELTKCHPPIAGFTGSVAVRRRRRCS
jgi:7,8-dihydroneopterin aldolase/epimerase/oxygenase